MANPAAQVRPTLVRAMKTGQVAMKIETIKQGTTAVLCKPQTYVGVVGIELTGGADVLNACRPRQTVRCACGHQVFDGIVVRSRVVRFPPRGLAEAMCRCKRWVAVPVQYAEPGDVDSVPPPSDTSPR